MAVRTVRGDVPPERDGTGHLRQRAGEPGTSRAGAARVCPRAAATPRKDIAQ